MARRSATYVYCVVASATKPKIPRAVDGLPGTGPVRLIGVDRGLYLVVADAPLGKYGEERIQRGLSDLDWVSRAAVAHEAVVESFIDAAAVLPMKLFTMFTTDERAVEHIRAERPRIVSLLKRLSNQHEWGVRVVLDRSRAVKAHTPRTRAAAPASGLAYLALKKAQRDSARELAERAQETVADLYDRLASKARVAKRRGANELPAQGGPLLLDAAFLVPRSRTASFRALAAREAKSLAPHGYDVTLTGPWPPYSFVQD
jgi:hypothetical protein